MLHNNNCQQFVMFSVKVNHCYLQAKCLLINLIKPSSGEVMVRFGDSKFINLSLGPLLCIL